MKPLSIKTIAHLLNQEADNLTQVQGVAVDSRDVKAGDLFFALPGNQRDGHEFLGEAAAKGAVGAIVKQNYHGPDHGLSLVRCPDTLLALQGIAKSLLSHSKAKVIAVTGSVGKTTTKEFIATLLKKRYRLYASPGNHNSQIGLPLTLLNNISLEEDFLVLEMGMTHPGDISKLLQIAPPTISVVTMIALVHACNFDSLQEIARAKAEIFSHPSTQLGIFPLQSGIHAIFDQEGRCPKISFSTESAEADFVLSETLRGMSIREYRGEPVLLPSLSVAGKHNQHNFLAAAVVARQVGLSWEEIIEQQAELQLPERRLEEIKKNGAIFINDSYNASEISVKAALNTLPMPAAGGKKIAVLGEMMELGKFSEQCHWAVGEHALKCVDLMLCFGEGCRPILSCWEKAGRHVVWAKEREQIVASLRQLLKPGDVVLLKGSRSKGVWKVLEEL